MFILKKSLVFFAALALVAGCATNPVTGKRQLSLVSEAQELNIGQTQYAPLRQMQGGDYVADPEVVTYVQSVGKKLAAVADRPLPYEFKVLNNSTPNAWALPGGKIVVNRGLLTELKSEAELAAVLGHEIVHAAARHTAQQMSRGVLLQGAIVATVIGTQGKDYAQLAEAGAGIGAQLVSSKFSRDHEREADHYGMIYMSRAGYDPQGAIELQKTFVELAKRGETDWLAGLFASHPPSQERVDANIETAKTLPTGGYVGAERYRAKMAQLIRTKPAYAAYDKGRKKLAEGNAAQARGLALQAVNIEPREALFFGLLGDAETQAGNTAKAMRDYDAALDLNDQFFYFYLQRGLLHAKLKEMTPAEQDLQASVALLPTSSAYYELGNIAKARKQFAKAKDYYAKAAKDPSQTGKSAYSALLEMDLPAHPDKYLQLRSGIDQTGRVKAEVSNPTPRDITGIVVLIQFSDNTGRTQEIRRPLQGVLKAGRKSLVDLGLKTSPERVKGLRTRIVAARVAP